MERNDAGCEGDSPTRIVHGGVDESQLTIVRLMNPKGQARSSSTVSTPERISNVNVPEGSNNNITVLSDHNAVQLHTSVRFLSPSILTSRDLLIRWVIAAHVSPEDHACKTTPLKNPLDPWRKLGHGIAILCSKQKVDLRHLLARVDLRCLTIFSYFILESCRSRRMPKHQSRLSMSMATVWRKVGNMRRFRNCDELRQLNSMHMMELLLSIIKEYEQYACI